MYNRAWHTDLSKKLEREDEAKELKGRYALVFQVELVLYLLEQLQMEKAVRAPWFLLSGLPLPLLATRLTREQQQILARARILSPYSGRFRWVTDLRRYMRVAVRWRAYNVKQGKIGRTGNRVERFDVYERSLTTPVPERFHHQKLAAAGERVMFEVFRSTKMEVKLSITPEIAQVGRYPIPWFTAPCQRADAIVLSPSMLITTGRNMTLLEQRYLQTQGVDNGGTDWEYLARNIHFRKRYADGKLSGVNEAPFVLQGHAHLSGTISAGKTNLMKFIAFLAAQEHWRVTLIVGDVMTALELVDFFNCLFCGDEDPPVAVPILGKTTLRKNLSRLCNTTSYQQRHRHRALRYLDMACLLLHEWPSPVPEGGVLGQEPCQRLIHLPSKEEEETELSEEETNRRPHKKILRSCPLFSICPMQRAYRDMFHASIWITTPGALGSVMLPHQIEARQMALWELIYEQSTLVCFDEADTIQNWFDRICAPEILLINQHGIFDRIDPQVADEWIWHRILEPESQRWVRAERHAIAITSAILTQLDYYGNLARWVYRTYFTAYSLFFRLACCFAGIQEPPIVFEFDPDYDDDDLQDDPIFPKQRNIPLQNKQFNKIMSWFYQVMESDPQQVPVPPPKRKDPVHQLLMIRRDILVQGSCVEEAQQWITAFIPNIRTLLRKKQSLARPTRGRTSGKSVLQVIETVETLALKLDFALMVSLLDAEMQTMYDEWYSGLINITGDYRFEHAPRHMLGLLPTPPTGSLFGFYHHKNEAARQAERDPREEEPAKTPSLQVFAYSLVGREFLTHFHQLCTAIDGRDGPHVLTLSGTSWLPHSSLWHIDVPSMGVLEPNKEAKRAIANSTFTFLPQYEEVDGQEKPIFVSGTKLMLQNLQKVARSLARGQQDHLRKALQNIREKEMAADETIAQWWRDRERLLLLVNSYDQVHVVAQEIARTPGLMGQVYGLKRGTNMEEDYFVEVSQWYKTCYRSNFEQFGETEPGSILVAPMQAIGRGYNALNKQKIAAFGAIYFLTRPMPHPFDAQAQASEMNKTVLDWCSNPKHRLWRYKDVYRMGMSLRQEAYQLWYEMDHRYGYHSLSVDKQKDLAATTAGLIMQACGRLIRGGVPFDAYFVDAAWGPRRAKKVRQKDTPRNSLLAAIIAVLLDYAKDPIGDVLLGPFVQALKNTKNFSCSISFRQKK
ncbi:hypothetical protein KSF_066360 [Reticulibacter mediterranei]|uniref:pPIWI-RE three-gene island domain-containing protein n=1 Tax=Reticulibacter mediterranei TaxID=2778369 RepID=A0A8J3IMA2_9CHLR|nr:hypothetical protein [Reticulibacter mediterranei]GHO96588.1 hypothetical protein KSF_066360 [Reticulibacter mediterranei]